MRSVQLDSAADRSVIHAMVDLQSQEEEEGTGIASDVVKAKGEDPATPGLLP